MKGGGKSEGSRKRKREEVGEREGGEVKVGWVRGKERRKGRRGITVRAFKVRKE